MSQPKKKTQKAKDTLPLKAEPEFLDYAQSQNKIERGTKHTDKNGDLDDKTYADEIQLHKHYIQLNLKRISTLLTRVSDVKPACFKEIDGQCLRTLELADKLLDMGHNVMFHGLGNKEEIVNDYFVKQYSSSRIIVKVRGYDANLMPKSFFLKLLQILNTGYHSDVQKHIESLKKKRNPNLEFIQSVFSILTIKAQLSLLIIFHNLDGVNFANKETLEIISNLAKEKEISFVATCDTIAFPQLLSRAASDNFSFIYFPLHTYRVYDAQLEYLNCIDFSSKGNQAASSVKGILESLTENQRLVYQRPSAVRAQQDPREREGHRPRDRAIPRSPLRNQSDLSRAVPGQFVRGNQPQAAHSAVARHEPGRLQKQVQQK
jgi:hypothetical protein